MKKSLVLLVGVFAISIILSSNLISGDNGISCGNTIYEDTVLTEDILNCLSNGIVIGADDITLDCDDHVIDSFEGSHGIYVISRNNVTIKNCIVQDFEKGIYLESSSSNNIKNNFVNNSFIGIYLRFSSNNILFGNTADNNRYGVVLASDSYSNNLTGNTVNNNIMHGIDLDTSSNNILTGNIANNNGVSGIYLRSTSNNVFTNNTAKNNQYGIYLHTSSDNSLNGNIIENDQYGAYLLSESHYNTFWNNKFTSNNISAYEEADSNNNNWNISDAGNYWDDFEANPSYPYYYEISGPGDGIDWYPIWFTEQGTAAYWKFDEGSGSILHDETGVNNGTIHGATWITGISGNALEFDGVDDYVEVVDNDSLDLSGTFTMEAWFKSTNIAGGVVIVSKEPNVDGQYGYYISIHATGVARFDIPLVGSYGQIVFGTTIVTDNNWHHVAGVRDSSNILHLYVDGVEEGTPRVGPGDTTNAMKLNIGRSPRWGAGYFNGTIDEVRISNIALDPSEFLLFPPEPTCNDGIQNGDEEGVDCGGSCPNECPLTLEERVEQLEQENEILKQQIQNNTQRINALEILVNTLQETINEIQQTLNNIMGDISTYVSNSLSNLPKGLRRQMICGAMEQTNITNSTGFGLYCEIDGEGCKCEDL